jgi:hypothetical protein
VYSDKQRIYYTKYTSTRSISELQLSNCSSGKLPFQQQMKVKQDSSACFMRLHRSAVKVIPPPLPTYTNWVTKHSLTFPYCPPSSPNLVRNLSSMWFVAKLHTLHKNVGCVQCTSLKSARLAVSLDWLTALKTDTFELREETNKPQSLQGHAIGYKLLLSYHWDEERNIRDYWSFGPVHRPVLSSSSSEGVGETYSVRYVKNSKKSFNYD